MNNTVMKAERNAGAHYLEMHNERHIAFTSIRTLCLLCADIQKLRRPEGKLVDRTHSPVMSRWVYAGSHAVCYIGRIVRNRFSTCGT